MAILQLRPRPVTAVGAVGRSLKSLFNLHRSTPEVPPETVPGIPSPQA
jgi:hypothetical protein